MSILARFKSKTGQNIIELVETPKGLVELQVNGDPLPASETKELVEWAHYFQTNSKEKE